ncbi:hypothetical protein B1B04_17185 [Lysinibacillus sp. KCTC 33748]|uniref:GbsR/MarR family transcriptional regulator n=1 Tax=unclassified Lysinibacillus TaxID=2636778 RepID=UPI0009A6E3C7|nr:MULTISPECIES: HTH domain-containing protein [unclassified Lysinibacillus]OXS72229.1 hypothetical protein B1B04_17185 [Lysinibacillus sp. KCTC 33748]SKB98964.1 DNA-binding transcriptional regulator GbsR, MarR family [Lysinibacillus sp. AC-3]
MSNLHNLQEQFSQELEKLSADGGNLLAARLFTALLFSSKPLSLQEMANQLGVTKAAVSIRIRDLEAGGLSVKKSKISDRKDYYYVAEDNSLIMAQTLLTKMKQFLSGTESILENWPEESDIQEDQLDDYHVAKKRIQDFHLIYQLAFQRIEGIEDEWRSKRKGID